MLKMTASIAFLAASWLNLELEAVCLKRVVSKATPQDSIRVARKEPAQVCSLPSVKISVSRRMEFASL